MLSRHASSILVALAAAGSADPLYDFADSPLTKLDDSSFESTVIKDEAHLWVVEYYADWCGHCKQFAKGFQKAATNLDGLVKFGAVNADEAKKTVQAAGVQGYPSVKVYVPGSGGRNPYTGKFYKPALDYGGPRTAKGVVDFATASLPSLVLPVTDKSLGKFKTNGTLPKALLFTKKMETTPLLKSLSVSLKGRMVLGEARDTAEKAVGEFAVTDFPTLVVLPSDADAAPIKYEGELKPQALAAFLEGHAAAAPAAEEGASSGASGGAAAEDDLSIEVTVANLKEVVEDERDAWVMVFAGTETSDLPAPGVAGLAEALYGQVKVARMAAELADKFGVKVGAQPTLATYPYRKAGVKRKVSKAFEPTEAGVAAAKKAALETLPEQNVEQLNAGNVDRFIQEAMQTSDTKSFCLLFSDKPTIPPLFRAISLAFEGKLGFGMAQASETAVAQRFNVQKAPTLLVMFPDESKIDKETGQVPLTGMMFTPQMHGKFNYGNIANFVAQIVEMRLKESGGGDPGAGEQQQQAPKAEKPGTPIAELSSENFDSLCVQKGGLCAIAMLDGSPENAASQERSLEMLTKLKKRKAGGPLAFSWLDATCQPNFAAAFGLSEVDLPTMIFISPTKLKWARAVGSFDVENLGGFGSQVAAGRKATETLETMPELDDVDCATVKRGAAAYAEEDEGADDIMAEILAEEARAREEREAELAAEQGNLAAAEAADKGEKKAKKDMSKLERLEADVEECEAMDLLCNARREKQLKAVGKERELQEKLDAIKRKKAKAKKKAKKAAKA